MRVRDLMTTNVRSCHPDDDLTVPGRIMWESDCGCVPVVDLAQRPVGVITDRDVCMAAYFHGRALKNIPVEQAMSRDVVACEPSDEAGAAERLMQSHQVRRLLVLDTQGRLVGIVSLNDLATRTQLRGRAGADAISPLELATTVVAIATHRSGEPPQLGRFHH